MHAAIPQYSNNLRLLFELSAEVTDGTGTPTSGPMFALMMFKSAALLPDARALMMSSRAAACAGGSASRSACSLLKEG